MIVIPEKYKNPDKQYRTAPHLIYSCQYHVIFCPKYRRKILNAPYDETVKQSFYQTAKEYEFDIAALEVMPDHVHMIIDCNPRFGIDKCISLLKRFSAVAIKTQHPEIKTRLPNIWTRSAFISTVGTVTLDVVKKYVEEQKGV